MCVSMIERYFRCYLSTHTRTPAINLFGKNVSIFKWAEKMLHFFSFHIFLSFNFSSDMRWVAVILPNKQTNEQQKKLSISARRVMGNFSASCVCKHATLFLFIFSFLWLRYISKCGDWIQQSKTRLRFIIFFQTFHIWKWQTANKFQLHVCYRECVCACLRVAECSLLEKFASHFDLIIDVAAEHYTKHTDVSNIT